MPLITVRTSCESPSAAAVDALLLDLSARVARHLGKPEAYVMTAFEAGVPMTFAGSRDQPVCYLELRSVGGFSPTTTAAVSADLCQLVADSLGVPPERTYVAFMAAEGYLWGWNGRTFG
ncbi:phenylpyruvate tautomerase MIF-related protein [Cyanobium sp. NIES-981]|uniref:phenylpyruvate tautomerase MIF-related protein n=1 Tax=Cyanobium sp. NIES-981 TaxID=1851505 RepID=UPI0007DD896A|nr:phenylpyruvate tautomerase MIF-related protein [Cyanobium sp. NIES-981]SBO41856.1 Macrophage migration inhibitory factor [Cyanobium sp. NIES-981]